MAQARKAIVAFCGAAAIVGVVLQTADLTSTKGIVAALVAVATGLATYHVPNG